MKLAMIKGLVVLAAVLLLATSSLAGQPGNGFLSGPHYNLNIIGKKAGFTCPATELDEYDNPIYGNVVFVPETGTDSQINMVSGSTKGKTASTFAELKAIDACAGFDGNPARIQLPPSANGYKVFARALAKPTDSIPGPSMTMTPGLAFVQDETNTDLVYVGLVTGTGFKTPYQEVKRTKGTPNTVNISEMFMWAGTVCYAYPPADESGIPLPGYPPTAMCWVDGNGDTLFSFGDSIMAPIDGSCTTGDLTSLYCHTYDTEQWVFNIADLVEYFWSLDTNGSKLVQIRFYPQ